MIPLIETDRSALIELCKSLMHLSFPFLVPLCPMITTREKAIWV